MRVLFFYLSKMCNITVLFHIYFEKKQAKAEELYVKYINI